MKRTVVCLTIWVSELAGARPKIGCVSLPDSCEVPIGTVAWAITIPTGDLFISIAYQPLILPQSALPTLHLLQLSSLFTTFLAQHDISYVLAFSDNSALAVRYPCQP
jgi:hypothetical protein